jgi:hypothetical protein
VAGKIASLRRFGYRVGGFYGEASAAGVNRIPEQRWGETEKPAQ